MCSHYDFDYSKARPNLADGLSADTVAIVLDPDVAGVFQSSEAVKRFSGLRLPPCLALNLAVRSTPRSIRRLTRWNCRGRASVRN
jgi:hypothetical protein